MASELRAVLDIGSNTIRLLIAKVAQDQTFQKIHYQHHIARLGKGLQLSGKLGEAGQQRAMSIFKQIIEVCQSFGVQANEIIAVATAAVREASNGQAFVTDVREQTNLNIQIISGELEARLALSGARRGLSQVVGEDMLLFDIGGGSTEFTRVRQGQIVDSTSMKLGVVRLTESYVNSDPITNPEYQAMQDAAFKVLQEVESFWGNNLQRPTYLVGTAGTVTTLAAIVQELSKYDAAKIDGFQIPRKRFADLRDDLLAMTNAKRLAIPALEKGREDVIVAGLAIIDVMLSHWGYETMISVDSGLLVGLLGHNE